MIKPKPNRAGRDPGDDQCRAPGHACLSHATAVIATKVCILLPALVNGVAVCFLHYSIVWVVVEGVDVVADNAAGQLLSLPTGHGGVVGGNTARWDVLCQTTSTPASAGITIDASAGNPRAANKISPTAN